MAISHQTVLDRWAAQIDGEPETRSMDGGSIFARGDTIYSYGEHFPMARVMRDRLGRPTFVLLNADRYSVTTSGHQSAVRGALRACELSQLLVPFTALKAAGIDADSIRPLEILDSRWTVSHRRETVEQFAGGYRVTASTDGGYYVSDPETGARVVCEPTDDGAYIVPTFRHWLGEAVFSAETVSGYGETETRRRAKYLSAFDHAESRECYFLCELPRSGAQTVDDAFEALKPTAVLEAERDGLEVTRQGDVFAIPTDITTRELRKSGETVKRAMLLNTNHTASEVVKVGRSTYARGTLRHEPGAWRERDHAQRRMGDGKTWHRIVKNTVPAMRSTDSSGRAWGGGSSGRGAAQSGQNRAWTMGGAVD
jgi:hypothetical protein